MLTEVVITAQDTAKAISVVSKVLGERHKKPEGGGPSGY